MHGPDPERIHWGELPDARLDVAGLLGSRRFDLVLFDQFFWTGLSVTEQYLPLVRELQPETPVVVISDDCHWLREERRAEREQSRTALERSRALRAKERWTLENADLAAAITPEDLQRLQAEFPAARLRPLCFCQSEIPDSTPGFDATRPTCRACAGSCARSGPSCARRCPRSSSPSSARRPSRAGASRPRPACACSAGSTSSRRCWSAGACSSRPSPGERASRPRTCRRSRTACRSCSTPSAPRACSSFRTRRPSCARSPRPSPRPCSSCTSGAGRGSAPRARRWSTRALDSAASGSPAICARCSTRRWRRPRARRPAASRGRARRPSCVSRRCARRAGSPSATPRCTPGRASSSRWAATTRHSSSCATCSASWSARARPRRSTSRRRCCWRSCTRAAGSSPRPRRRVAALSAAS